MGEGVGGGEFDVVVLLSVGRQALPIYFFFLAIVLWLPASPVSLQNQFVQRLTITIRR